MMGLLTQATQAAQAAKEQLPPLALPDLAYADIGPMLILTAGAMILLTIASLDSRKPGRGVYALFTVCTAGGALGASAWLWNGLDDAGAGPRFAFSNMIAVDGFAVFFYVVISISIVLAALLGDGYLRREQLDGPEFYVLALLSGAGGMLMAAAHARTGIFLGLATPPSAPFGRARFHRRRAA